MGAQGTGWRTRREIGAWVVLLGVLVLLNGLLTFRNAWPTPWVRFGNELSVELALMLVVLALYAQRFGPPRGRLLGGLSVVVVLLVIGRYAVVTAPALYGRRINLYWDAQHIPAVVAMIAEAGPAWIVGLAVAAALGLLALLFAVARWCLRAVGAGLGAPGQRRFLFALGASLSALYFGGHASEALRTEKWFAVPVSRSYAEQAGFLVDALRAGDAMRSLPGGLPALSDLAHVRNSDVFVVFLESYGAVAYDNSRFARELDSGLRKLESAINESGHAAVSAFVRSPTFGSGSWRAHLSLLSGVEVGDERTYKLLLTTDRATLVDRLKAAGHRAVALMPGLKRAWPEGAFYRFDRIYGAADLDYRGPAFGWWRIPDQFSLARFHEQEVRPEERAPLFVVFPTISSHAPFRPTPPYQEEWRLVLGASPFGEEALAEALGRKPDWADPGAGYADAMNYSLAMVAGYLREHDDRERVMIVLGDHQPPAGVSGSDASRDVPVHVISGNRAILATLVAAGFEEGLRPRRQSIGKMHELGPVLLAAFGSGTEDGGDATMTLARAVAP